MTTIDWRVAQLVAETVTGTPAHDGDLLPPPSVGELAAEISRYSHLTLTAQPPPIELVDRPRWIAANLNTMKPVLEPLGDRLGTGLGPLAPAARSAAGLLLGAQVGALTGMLAQRVLGQYDLSLLDDSVQPRLLLLAPNLAEAAANLSLDSHELTAWVTIHEVTHAVQFSGAPWMRGHLGGLLRELIDSMQVRPANSWGLSLKDLSALRDISNLRAEIGELIAQARRGELLRITLGEDRWTLVDRIQSAMSLIEGHAEHVMDVVGARVLPSLPELRAALDRRRRTRPLPWRVLERLLGLELKMRQYELGRRFCDAVVAEDGPGRLAIAFRSPALLPTSEELNQPELWMSRTSSTAAETEAPIHTDGASGEDEGGGQVRGET